MPARVLVLTLSALCSLPAAARTAPEVGTAPGAVDGCEEPQWKLREDGAVKVYTRERVGTLLQEVKATAVFDVDAATLHEVATDLDHFADFFPFIEESKVLARGDGYLLAYQRSNVPMLSERDYVVRVDERIEQVSGRRVFKNIWSPGPQSLGPAPKNGVIRVAHVEGYWAFEELGPKKARATYYLFTDPKGSVPPFIVNLGSRQGLPTVFAAVEKEAKRRATRKRAPPDRRQGADVPTDAGREREG